MQNTKDFSLTNAKITRHEKCALIENTDSEFCTPVLLLRGNDYEKGFAYGKLLAHRLSSQVSRLLTTVYALDGGFAPDGKTAPGEEVLQNGKKRALKRVNEDLMPAIKQHTPFMLQQVQGMFDGIKSEGEKIDYDDLLIFATTPESIDRPAGCSSFSAWGGATKSGELIHAANQDFESYGTLHKNIIMIAEECEGGYTYMGPAFLGMVSAASFINSANLSYSEMTSSSKPYVWPQIPHYWQAKLIAKSAKTVDEAYKIAQTTGGTTGWNLLVSQTAPAQTAASIELVGEKIGKRVPTAAAKNKLFVTNHFMAYPGTEGYEGPNLVQEQFELFSTKKSAIKRLFGDENVQWCDIDTPEKWQALIQCPRYLKYEELLMGAHVEFDTKEANSADSGNIDVELAITAQSAKPICDFGEDTAPKAQYTDVFKQLYGFEAAIEAQSLRSIYSCVMLPESGTIYLAAGAVPAQCGTFYKYNMNDIFNCYL